MGGREVFNIPSSVVPWSCRRWRSGLIIVKAPLALGVVGHEGMVTLLSDDAGLHQVVDEDGRPLVQLQLLLVLLQLALGILKCGLMSRELALYLVKPGHLGAGGVFLLEVGRLGVGDLHLGPSALGARLEHVHPGAVEHYREKKD